MLFVRIPKLDPVLKVISISSVVMPAPSLLLFVRTASGKCGDGDDDHFRRTVSAAIPGAIVFLVAAGLMN
jgi:hypothetical protein